MSREIKFRAWDKELGEMLLPEEWKIPRIQLDGSIYNEYGDQMNSSDYILEQYTGLTDKNGKEIYEGDIIRWTDDYDENGYINFDEGCFWVNWSINSERINGDMVDDLEVIGNIHENPELLGGKE